MNPNDLRARLCAFIDDAVSLDPDVPVAPDTDLLMTGLVDSLGVVQIVSWMEQELGIKSTHTIGRSHNIADSAEYKNRIEAINFSLAHDDGQSHKNLASADVILVEGFKWDPVPKLEVFRPALGQGALYLRDEHIVAVASDVAAPQDLPPHLCWLNLNDQAAILAWFLQQLAGS